MYKIKAKLFLIMGLIMCLIVLYNIDYDDLYRHKIKKRRVKHMKNQDIRIYLKKKGLCLWQLADKLKISEASMTRKMRKELSKEEKEKIIKVIKEMEG